MGARKIKTVCKIFAINTACKRFQTMVWTPLIWLDDQMDARPASKQIVNLAMHPRRISSTLQTLK
jgi:hypothetical protein